VSYSLRIHFLALGAMALAMASPALAQSADGLRPSLDGEEDPAPVPLEKPKITQLAADPVVVEEVPRRRRPAPTDPYAPTGLDLGAFRLFPAIETGVSLSSNPANRAANAKADAGIYLKPSIRLESDWVRHQFNLNAKGDGRAYLSGSSADAQTLDLDTKLRLDVLRSTTLEFDTAYGLESAGNAGDAGNSGLDHTVSDFAALTHRMGRLEARARAGLKLKLFGDTAGADNSDLDYAEPEVSLRASYDLAPAFKPFVETGYRPRAYLKTRDRNGARRGSDAVFAGLGAALDLDPVWSADAAVNYLIRDYHDAALGATGSLSARASVTWTPTGLSTVTLAAASDLADGTSANVSGARNFTLSLDASHALRENVTLTANAGFEAESGDETYTAGLGALYRLTPWLALTTGYDVTRFDSAAAGADYTEHRATAGVEFRR
jgi:hypothetical protein